MGGVIHSRRAVAVATPEKWVLVPLALRPWAFIMDVWPTVLTIQAQLKADGVALGVSGAAEPRGAAMSVVCSLHTVTTT